MLSKIAFRNVKRQVNSYLIYFITVTLTVAFMFAINNIIFSNQIQQFTQIITEMRAGLISLTIIIALIVSFVLGYATSFMLKFRKREFGTYLTLGMTRTNILTIFIFETLILGIVALALGIFLGLFIYQGVMMIMCNLMEMQITFGTYSIEAMAFTIIIVCIVFFLSSLTSAIYLKRTSIYNLIHGEKMVDKRVKHPVLWAVITVLSFILIIFCCFYFNNIIIESFKGKNSSGIPLVYTLIALAAGIFLFHIGLCRSIVNLLLKSRNYCAKQTNTFTLRQLSGKLRTNSIMVGILAFLITFAVIGSNFSFTQKISEQVSLDKNFPYDISLAVNPKGPSPITLEQGEKIIQQYNEIKNRIDYNVYTNNKSYVYSFTQWTGDGYEGLTDSFIKESDFNKLITGLGYEPISLNGTFKIVTDFAQVAEYDFSKAVLQKESNTYTFGGIETDYPTFFRSCYLAIIVPDVYVQDMDIEYNCYVYDLKNDKYDANALNQALSYITTIDSEGEAYQYIYCNYDIKEAYRIQRNSVSAILIVGTLYIAVVFVFLAMAILALKSLSSIVEDKQKYRILYRLGAGQKEQSKALFKEVFSFFFLPFVTPLLLGVPTSIICSKIMSLSGFAANSLDIYINAILISLVLISIYALYFTATYIVLKRNVICTDAN